MKTLTLMAFGMIMTAQHAFACMAPPVPIKWFTPKGSNYHFSVTMKGVVSVVAAKDHKKVLWKATLSQYVQHADTVYVVDDGKRIVSVRNNGRINKLTDVAVETITKSGETMTIAAKELTDKLLPGTPPGQPRMSIDPKYRYMKSVKTVDAKGITIINASGKAKTIAWGK